MLRKLLVALVVAVGAVPAGAQALEVKAGSPLEIETLTVRADVDEGIALVDVDQVFRNHTDAVQEGVYRFRLPEKAVVHSFSMWIEGKEKHGRVLEAGQARRIYDSIVARKKDPALLEEIGWRRFQVSVFPIPARDTVRIRLVYAHVVDDDLGLRTLEIPLPEGTPVGVADVTVRVRDRQGVAVLDCPTHADADVLHDEVLGAIRWSQEGYTASGPFRVRSAPAVRGLGLACLAFRPESAAEGTFLVRVVPRLDDVPDLPRDVVFVIDRSGSMKGKKLEQAKAALRYGLATLKPGDRFSIVAFSSGVHQLGDGGLAPVNDAWRTEAGAFTDALTASGGTNIDAALQRAAGMRSDDPSRLFVVSFLTDGNPTVGEKIPDRIVARYRERSAGKVRLFAFGVGADVKDFLLTRLARDSRGAAEYVRENEDLEVKLSALFDKVRSPILTDVSVRVKGPGVHVLGVEPELVPDVFRGTAVVVAGRYTGSGAVRIELSGRVGTAPVEARLDADLPSAAGDKPHVAQLWARMRIDRLLDELRVHGMVDEIRQEIIALGLKYQVVTPYTSFLVVEDGIHIPDDGELARVPEGPDRPMTGGGHVGGPSSGGGGVPSHGGAYRGPSGEVPPDSREPSDPPPAPETGGPTSPGGDAAGPTTGGGDGGGESGGGAAHRGPSGDAPPPPSGGDSGGSDLGGGDGGSSEGASAGAGDDSGPGASGGGGAAAGRGKGGVARDYSWWRFWWQTHREALHTDSARTGASIPRALRDTVVLPALRHAVLSGDGSFAIRSESQRALAAWGDEAEHVRALTLRMLTASPADGERAFHRVCEERSARLLLCDELDGASRARLLAIVTDPGREGSYIRAYAALVLGLGGSDAAGDVIAALVSAADDTAPKAHLLRPSAILALGLLGDTGALPELLRMLDERDRVDLERAYVVDAIGRLGRPGEADGLGRGAVTEKLIGVLGQRRREAAVVRRSVPAALARICSRATARDQAAIVDALRKAWRAEDDTTVAASALLAAGRIAGSLVVEERVSRSARVVLESEWKRQRGTELHPFVALALGRAAAGDTEDPLRKLLRSAIAAPGDPDLTAASAVALGTLRDRAAAPALRRIAFDPSHAPDLRTDCIEALARCDDGAALPQLLALSRDALRARTEVSAAARRAAVALGDVSAVSTTVEALELGHLDELEPALRVLEVATLGTRGDAETAERLATIVRNEERMYSDRSRELAARALGALAGAPDLRLRIADDFPYRAYSAPIWEFMDWR